MWERQREGHRIAEDLGNRVQAKKLDNKRKEGKGCKRER